MGWGSHEVTKHPGVEKCLPSGRKGGKLSFAHSLRWWPTPAGLPSPAGRAPRRHLSEQPHPPRPHGRAGRSSLLAPSGGPTRAGHLSGGHVSGRSGRGGPGPQAPAAPAGIGSERRPAPPRGPFLTVLRRLRAQRPPHPTPVGCGWPCPGLQFLTRRALGGTRGTQGRCSRLVGETEGELEPPTAVRDTVRVRPFHRHRAPPGDPRRCAGCSRFEGEAAK